MAEAGLFGRRHLAEGAALAFGDEDGVVAESAAAARLGRDLAVDAALVERDLAVGPGQAQGSDEGGAAVGALEAAVALREAVEDAAHRGAEVAAWAGPVGGVDARRA